MFDKPISKPLIRMFFLTTILASEKTDQQLRQAMKRADSLAEFVNNGNIADAAEMSAHVQAL